MKHIEVIFQEWRCCIRGSFQLPRIKLVFGSTLLFYVLAHIFGFLNVFPTGDSVNLVSTVGEGIFQISIGRFLQVVNYWFRGRINAPFLIGFISYVYLGVALYLLVDLLEIRKKWMIVALCGIFSTSFVLTCAIASYINWVDVYMMCFMFATIGVFITDRFTNIARLLPASICFAAVLGLYPAYISVAIGLLLIRIVQKSLSEESPLSNIKSGLWYALSLILGVLLYVLILKIVVMACKFDLSNSYNSPIHSFDSGVQGVLAEIPRAYTYFLSFILKSHSFSNPIIHWSNIIFSSFCAFTLVILLWHRRKDYLNVGLCILACALLPLGLNFIAIFSAGTLHHLMIFGFYLIYALFAVVFLQFLQDTSKLQKNRVLITLGKGIYKGFIILLLCMIFKSIVYSNGAYLYKQIVYDSILSMMTRITTQMDMNPQYIPGETPILIVSGKNLSKAFVYRPGFEQYYEAIGMTYFFNFYYYFPYIIGEDATFLVDSAKQAELEQSTEVQQIQGYPYGEYCKFIDGVMVIKFN